jgi:hypothetical protein
MLAMACGSSIPSGGFSPGCLHFAEYLTNGKCGSPLLPATEAARVRPRYASECENLLALPGTRITSSRLDACLAALEAGGCRSATLPDVCNTAGSLAGGAVCNAGSWQCESGKCSGFTASGYGGVVSSACGACLPAIAVGRPCDAASSQCVPGSLCVNAGAGATCVAPGDVGAPCDQDSLCKSGLFCDIGTLQCANPIAAGGPCNDVRSCVYPLVCSASPTGGVCQDLGQVGAPCLNDGYCAAGLGCAKAHTCGKIARVSPGEACDGDLVRCLVGGCAAGVQCAAVIADGLPCDAADLFHTCDAGARCYDGVCTPLARAGCH